MTSSEFIPSSQENYDRQENLTRFLEYCKVFPIGAPRGSWNNYTNKTKRQYLNHFKECLSAVIDCFFPSNKDVIEKLVQSH